MLDRAVSGTRPQTDLIDVDDLAQGGVERDQLGSEVYSTRVVYDDERLYVAAGAAVKAVQRSAWRNGRDRP